MQTRGQNSQVPGPVPGHLVECGRRHAQGAQLGTLSLNSGSRLHRTGQRRALSCLQKQPCCRLGPGTHLFLFRDAYAQGSEVAEPLSCEGSSLAGVGHGETAGEGAGRPHPVERTPHQVRRPKFKLLEPHGGTRQRGAPGAVSSLCIFPPPAVLIFIFFI